MNREQQRRNARDQRRLEARKRARQAAARPQPARTPAAPSRRYATTLEPGGPRRAGARGWLGAVAAKLPWVVAGAVIALIAVLFFVVDPLGLRTPLPGYKLPTQGNVHINPGQTHQAYITDPPASGPHFPPPLAPPARGIYTSPFADEILPHFLEHGGVEVLYNSSAPPDVVQKLTDIVNAELDRGV